MKRLSLFSLACSLLLLAGCDSSGPDVETPPPAELSTWQTIQQQIFAKNCTDCHQAGTSFATQSGLVLTEDVAYEQLVDVPPRNGAARDDGLVRLSKEGLPGLYKSFLWEKVNAPNQEHYFTAHPQYGSMMPLGRPPLTNGELKLIEEWIRAGAPKDGIVIDHNVLADTSRFQAAAAFQPLTAPERGLALRLGPFDVAPNFEREFFYFEPSVSAEDLFIDRFEISMRPGSHHFILYTFGSDLPPSLDPTPHTYRDIRKPNGTLDPLTLAAMQHHVFFAGTQWPTMDFRFPPGVALRLPAGTGLDLNSHYVNRTEQTRQGEVHINLHTVPAEEVVQPAEILFLNNIEINLPPKQTTTLVKTYRFQREVNIFQLVSHAHQHMQEFRVYVDGGPRDGELVYVAYDWQHPPILQFDTPLTLAPGQGLRLEATYNNWTDKTLRFGLLSEDEMMILFGYYY